jgi:DNA-binding CsgD family transcriptional regulator
LEYNGSIWNLYPLPGGSIVRSVKAVDDIIYTGSYMDFGVWTRHNSGVLRYESLVQKLNINVLNEEQFWKIEKMDSWIIFQSFSRIYMLDTKTNTLSIIESDEPLLNMFVLDDVIYFQQENKGIYKLINGQNTLVTDHSELKDTKVLEIFKQNENLIIITSSKGVFQLANGFLKKWKLDTQINFGEMSIYSALKLKDDSVILGTISNGLFHLTSRGTLKYNLNFEKGLSNNTVLSIYEDQKNNIWLGLDIGINLINQSSQFRVYNDTKGNIGTIYASVVFQGHLYLGTNQGLFYKKRNSGDDFKLVTNTNGQVWSLKVIDNQLFCGHDRGTFVINNKSVVSIFAQNSGSWDFKVLKDNPSIILQGNYFGLSLLEKQDGRWNYRNKIDGFNLSSRFYHELDDKLIVNHEIRGLYEMTLSEDLLSVKNVKNVETTPRATGSNIIKFSENYLYTTSQGIYDFDSENSTLNRSKLSEILDKYTTTTTLLDVNNTEHYKWCFADENILIISPGSLPTSPKIETIPVALESFYKAVAGFENMSRISESEFLVGSSNEYYIFQSNIGPPNHNYNININSSKSNRIDQPQIDLDLNGSNVLESDFNNIALNFSVPHYDDTTKTYYSFQLEGYSDNWSTWQTEPYTEFKNLPYGGYSFKVKGKVGNTLTNNQAVFNFVIKRPWYLSSVALIIYGFLLIGLSFVIHNIYKRYYRKQNERLLKQSQKELELHNLENTQMVMKLRNEKLELEIENKNRELAISTMSLIKKNEFLNSIKSELKGVDDYNLKRVIKIIDKNLNNTDDWKLFEEAFNNADKDFLKIIKDKHSALTPNDLRLCAYLRLNLSSKEIAPLLNISTRSVEVKRYRLRKKMNLPREASLTNYILEI